MKNRKYLWIVAAMIAVAIIALVFGHKKANPVQPTNVATDTIPVAKKVAMVIPATLQAFSEIETGLRTVCPEPNYNVRVF